MGRYIDKNRSDFECSMVWHKHYSEISPSLKVGIAVDEEVEFEDGEAVGPLLGATVDGAAVGTVEGLYSQPQ